jgi:hypothetical protein
MVSREKRQQSSLRRYRHMANSTPANNEQYMNNVINVFMSILPKLAPNKTEKVDKAILWLQNLAEFHLSEDIANVWLASFRIHVGADDGRLHNTYTLLVENLDDNFHAHFDVVLFDGELHEVVFVYEQE